VQLPEWLPGLHAAGERGDLLGAPDVLPLSHGPGRLDLVDLQLYGHESRLELRRLMIGSNRGRKEIAMHKRSVFLVTLCWAFAAACNGSELGGSDGGAGASAGGAFAGGTPNGGDRATGGLGTGGSATVPCPPRAPASGSSCPSSGQQCVYQDCASTGVTLATCQTTWSVTTSPCPTTVHCASYPGPLTCATGQICLVSAGGTIDAECIDNACGAAPVDCSCLGVCAGVCNVMSSSTGVTMYCNTCPQGGCP